MLLASTTRFWLLIAQGLDDTAPWWVAFLGGGGFGGLIFLVTTVLLVVGIIFWLMEKEYRDHHRD